MDIQNLLHLTVTNKASDLHLVPGSPPAMRVDGSLNYLSNSPPLSKEEVETMIFSLINSFQKDSI